MRSLLPPQPQPWAVDPRVLATLRLQRAAEALDASDPDIALVEVEEFLSAWPGDPDGLRLSARAALQLGDAGMARAALEALDRIESPLPASDLVSLAIACIECADLHASLQAAQRASQAQPTLAIAWYYQGLAHERMGSEQAAEHAFRQAHSLDPASHPQPAPIEESAWGRALTLARAQLPAELQAHYASVSIEWASFPSRASLVATDPPLSPFIDSLSVLPEPDPTHEGQPALVVRLFRGNLSRPDPKPEELAQRITSALVREAQEWVKGPR